jgi:hypothetical protein
MASLKTTGMGVPALRTHEASGPSGLNQCLDTLRLGAISAQKGRNRKPLLELDPIERHRRISLKILHF